MKPWVMYSMKTRKVSPPARGRGLKPVTLIHKPLDVSRPLRGGVD